MSNNTPKSLDKEHQLLENKKTRNESRALQIRQEILWKIEKKMWNSIGSRRLEEDPIVNLVIEELIDAKLTSNSNNIQQKLAIRQISRNAEIDALTGIKNRAAFEKKMSSKDTLQKKRDLDSVKKDLSWLVLIDLDNFKQINDTQGHGIWDEVLKEIVGIMRNRLRNSDFFARIWWDEFAIIIDNTSEEHVKNLSEILRKRIEGKDVAVTLSIGIAPFSSTWSSVTLDEADTALYLAKWTQLAGVEIDGKRPQGTRNRTTIFDPKAWKYQILS